LLFSSSPDPKATFLMKPKIMVIMLVSILLISLGGMEWLLASESGHSSLLVTRASLTSYPSVKPAQPAGSGFSLYLPLINSFSTPTPLSTETTSPVSVTFTPTAALGTVQETFESNVSAWEVLAITSGTGNVIQTQAQSAAGSSSALLRTAGSGSTASVAAQGFSDQGGSHVWGERPGAFFWQRAMIYLPSASLRGLGAQGYLDLAGFWPSSGGTFGWWLRVRQNGQGNAALSVFGYDANGRAAEFIIYGLFPLDRWVDFTMGLNSQNGPGVKRAFALLIDGNFYGWYRQGHMSNENFNQAAIGIIHTNAAGSLNVYVDQWYAPSTQPLPASPDNRSTVNLQTQDFRSLSGVQWQIDWSTWQNDLLFDPTHGLYSSNNRLQSGRNLDRMPDLTSGWAQIEIDWTRGIPPDNSNLSGSFAGLIGFHKEINREQNLEVSPIIVNDSAALIYDCWTGSATVLASWALPKATLLSDGRNIPEPGDILRVRWEKTGPTLINLRASYYDASTATWYRDVINNTHNLSSVPSQDSSLPGSVNFLDGNHQAASITIDTPFYSIRTFTVGTLDTYPNQ
jgi:hypothetical protein